MIHNKEGGKMWKCYHCGHANWMKLDRDQEDTCCNCGKLRMRNRVKSSSISNKDGGYFHFSTEPWNGYWSRKAEAEIS
jgi:hypothetical protein